MAWPTEDRLDTSTPSRAGPSSSRAAITPPAKPGRYVVPSGQTSAYPDRPLLEVTATTTLGSVATSRPWDITYVPWA